jgi:hypothetical protein
MSVDDELVCWTRGVKLSEVSDEWNEEDHPRDPNGEFASGGGIGPIAEKHGSDAEYQRAREQFAQGRLTQQQLNKETAKVNDVSNIDVKVYRVGSVERAGRGVHFGDSPQSIEQYRSIHPGEEIKEYRVVAGKTGVTRNHMTLHQNLFGSSFQDAVWKEDKKSGFKSSIEAGSRVEAKMAKEASKRGYEAMIYTHPPAPAKHELVVYKKGVIK